jgi:drug/metabolite transporter (DMT)-like permease
LRRGALFVFAAAVCFGSLGTLSKLYYERGGRPFELLLVRFAGAAIVLGALALVRRRPLPPRRVLAVSAGLGAAQIGSNTALLEGFKHAPASLIVLLFYVYPLLVAIGAALLLGERLGRRRAAVLAVGLAGIGLTVGAPGSVSLLGVALGLSAGICTATYVVGARHVLGGGIDAIELTAIMYGGPALVFGLAAGVRGVDLPTGSALGLAATIVVVATIVPMTLFFAGVKLVGASTAALLATVEPFVGVLLAYLALGERLTALQLLGGALIVGAVATLALPLRSRRLRRTAPAPAPRAPGPRRRPGRRAGRSARRAP